MLVVSLMLFTINLLHSRLLPPTRAAYNHIVRGGVNENLCLERLDTVTLANLGDQSISFLPVVCWLYKCCRCSTPDA